MKLLLHYIEEYGVIVFFGGYFLFQLLRARFAAGSADPAVQAADVPSEAPSTHSHSGPAGGWLVSPSGGLDPTLTHEIASFEMELKRTYEDVSSARARIDELGSEGADLGAALSEGAEVPLGLTAQRWRVLRPHVEAQAPGGAANRHMSALVQFLGGLRLRAQSLARLAAGRQHPTQAVVEPASLSDPADGVAQSPRLSASEPSGGRPRRRIARLRGATRTEFRDALVLVDVAARRSRAYTGRRTFRGPWG